MASPAVQTREGFGTLGGRYSSHRQRRPCDWLAMDIGGEDREIRLRHEIGFLGSVTGLGGDQFRDADQVVGDEVQLY